MADENTAAETAESEAPKDDPTPKEEAAPEAKADGGDDLPAAVREILNKERKAARDAEKARKAAEQRIKEYEDRDKTESEKLAERAAAAEKDRDEALTRLTRFEVAAEKKLPGDLVDLLTGTREEMEAKADTLLAHIKAGEPSPDFDGGAREAAPEAKSPQDAHRDFLVEKVFGLQPTQNT